MNPLKSFKRLACTLVLLAACVSLPLIHGCGTVNPSAGQPVLNPATGQPATNSAGQPVLQPALLPNATGTAIVGYVNQAAPLIPAPWSDLLTLGAAAATLVMGGIAKVQSNKAATATATANNATAANTSLTGQLTAVVQGVESATAAPTVTAASVKTAIQQRATASGVQPALDATVQALTS